MTVMVRGRICGPLKSKKNIDAYDRKELLEIAKTLGIKGFSKLSKEELCNKIASIDAESKRSVERKRSVKSKSPVERKRSVKSKSPVERKRSVKSKSLNNISFDYDNCLQRKNKKNEKTYSKEELIILAKKIGISKLLNKLRKEEICKLIDNFLKGNSFESKVKSSPESKVKSSIESKVKSSLESKVKSSLESKVKSSLESKVKSSPESIISVDNAKNIEIKKLLDKIYYSLYDALKKKYIFLDIIGAKKGIFNDAILKVKNKENNRLAVLKFIVLDSDQKLYEYAHEVSMFKKFMPLDISAKYYDSFGYTIGVNKVGIIEMEYIDGDLYNLLEYSLTDSQINDIANQLHNMITKMRSYGIVHGDMHGGNVGYVIKNNKINLLLIDFGYSCCLYNKARYDEIEIIQLYGSVMPTNTITAKKLGNIMLTWTDLYPDLVNNLSNLGIYPYNAEKNKKFKNIYYGIFFNDLYKDIEDLGAKMRKK